MSSPEEKLRAVALHLESNPGDASAWNTQGVMLAQLEKFGDALRSLNQSIKLDSNFAAAYTNRGQVLLALGKDKAPEALKSFNRALQLSPNNLDALKDKAVALRALGKSAEELACLKAIVTISKDDWRPWLRIGDIQLESGRFKGAVKSFKRALELDEKNVPALLHQSIAFSMLDQWKDAVKSAETACKLAPDNIETWRVLADANLRAEKYKSAMKALKKAASLDPTDAPN